MYELETSPSKRLRKPKRVVARGMANVTKRGGGAGARQNFYLQIVTVPTADTAGTGMVLNFDNESYFFGQPGEGLQRACIQRGISLRKMGKLFLTGSSEWKAYGGLIGLILSLADIETGAQAASPESARKERLHIHMAPRGLHLLACARRFVFRSSMPLTVHESKGLSFEWQDEPTYADDNIRVWSVPLRADAVAQIQNVESRSDQTMANGANIDKHRESYPPEIEDEQALRKKVVFEMFESEWRRDRLFERPFQEVKMPATVWLRDPETKELQGFHCASHDSAPQIGPEQIVLVRDPWPASLVHDLPKASNLPGNVSMSYIVKGYPQRGTFDPTKAKSLGVKPGPAFSELIEGGSITLGDGTIVTSDMALGPTREGKGFAFFDIPSISHLRSVQRIFESQPPAMLEGVSAIVWMLGPGVTSGETFGSVLSSLPSIKHIVSDVDSSPNRVTFESVALSNLMPARIAPSQFPALTFNNMLSYQNQRPRGSVMHGSPLKDHSGLSLAKPGVKISVQRSYIADESEVPQPFHVDNVRDTELAQTLEALQRNQNQTSVPSADLTEPEIITLGTGSALPSKYRNVSATLLRMPGNQGNYLFDCGENTIGQLRRLYPAPELRSILQDLRAIWISHLHADHHLGTISVLQERAIAFEGLKSPADPIYLISEPNMLDFIREYSSVEPDIMAAASLVPIVSSDDAGTTSHGKPFSFDNSCSAIRKIESVPVSHCAGAQAVSLTFKSGFKISYSGDCRPSGSFCRIGRDSDVLIHEATFDDGMEGDAMAKRHSTTAEALGVALNMRAKNVVLTHFSQRYAKIPNFENIKLPNDMHFEEVSAKEEDGPIDDGSVPSASASNTASSLPRRLSANGAYGVSEAQPAPNATGRLHIAIAFDYMRVRVSEIAGLKDIYPKIQALFDEQEHKAEAERQERIRKEEEKLTLKQQKHLEKQRNQQSKKPKTHGKNQTVAQNGSVRGAHSGQPDAREPETAEAKSDQMHDQIPSDFQRHSNNVYKRQLKEEALARAHKRRSLETSPEAGRDEVAQHVASKS